MEYQQYTTLNSRKNALLNDLEYILHYNSFIQYFSIELKEEFDFIEIIDLEKKLKEDSKQKINNIINFFKDEQITLPNKRFFLEELKDKLSSLLKELNELTEPIYHIYSEDYFFNFTTTGENQIHSIIFENGTTINAYFNKIFDLENLSNSKQNVIKQTEKEQDYEISTINSPNKFYSTFEKVLLLRLLNKFNILNLDGVSVESQKRLLSFIFNNPPHSFTDCHSGKKNDTAINSLIDEAITKNIKTKRNLNAYLKLKPLLNEFNNEELNKHIDNIISQL